jgi:Na+-driven multidrug efflux pump
MGTAIIGSVGDNRRPLFFMISAGLNILLDLLFVIVFKMGVLGVALATVIAQGITATLVVIALLRDTDCIKIIPSKLGINFTMLGKIFRVGIPAAFQLIIVAIAEVLVQRYFNTIPGTDDMNSIEIMSGYTIYTRIEEFMLLPIQALSVAITNFVGQNVGKSQHKRARRGTLAALGLAMLFTTLVVVLVNLFTPEIVSLFTSKENAIRCGVLLLRFISPFYLICCFIQIFMGSVSGVGRTFVPMIIMVTSFIGARQLYLYMVTGFVSNSVVSVGLAYPVGWICAGIAMIVYYTLCEYDTMLLEAELAAEAEIAAKAEFDAM